MSGQSFVLIFFLVNVAIDFKGHDVIHIQYHVLRIDVGYMF